MLGKHLIDYPVEGLSEKNALRFGWSIGARYKLHHELAPLKDRTATFSHCLYAFFKVFS